MSNPPNPTKPNPGIKISMPISNTPEHKEEHIFHAGESGDVMSKKKRAGKYLQETEDANTRGFKFKP